MVGNKELTRIKKIYGEKFMHLCRELFPTLLETEGRLLEILQETFSNNSSTLYEDIIENELEEDFKNYIYSKIDIEDSEKRIIENKTPYELLAEAGYDLYECTTEEEIQAFKKYYAPNEELCTFHGGRLNRCVVFFAVRKDVENIKRGDFTKPKREDEYGTSVMGIQFNKQGLCTVSIKNRYNHTVNNPDATYGNDLDKIAPGLTQSFSQLLKERGLELDNSNIEYLEMLGYVVANDGRYYKYNEEIDGVYYCPGNIIVGPGTVNKLPNHQMLIDYFIVDTKAKTITVDNEIYSEDSFVDDLVDIEKIEILKSNDQEHGTRKIIIHKKNREHPIIIEINKNNEIVGYENRELQQVGDSFLGKNISLIELKTPQLQQVGNGFLYDNEALKKLDLSQLQQVGHTFLRFNKSLTELNLPQLQKVGNIFLYENTSLIELNLPRLQQVGDGFLQSNISLLELNLPRLQQVGNSFLFAAPLKKLSLPELQQVGNSFLFAAPLKKLSLPELQQVGKSFIGSNTSLIELNLPRLQQVGDGFLWNNASLLELNLPELQQIGIGFLANNTSLTELKLPKLQQVGYDFLNSNPRVKMFRAMIKKNKRQITSTDIAKLDKQEEITTSEVSWVSKMMAKLREKAKEFFTKGR